MTQERTTRLCNNKPNKYVIIFIYHQSSIPTKRNDFGFPR